MAVTNAKPGASLAPLLMITCLGLAAAGCGGSSSASPGGGTASQTASVAYAASLEFLNEKVAGPAFTKAEGYGYSGRAGASGGLEAEIASGEISPNVFESVGGDNITPLFGKYTKWYIRYAGTQIVVAYNPAGKYASQFRAIASGKEPLRNLFRLMLAPGFRLGRTDPNSDPQGRDFIYMLELAQAYYHLPSDTVTRILGGQPASASSTQIYAESSLDATLQSGQLDAASAFLTQATELHLSYIKLPAAISLGSLADAALYHKASIKLSNGSVKSGSPQVIDITIIGKPTPAAVAFVRYTLSPAGRAQYKAGGFALLRPAVTGEAAAIPAAIRGELG